MPGNGAAASYGDLLITSLVVLAGVCIAAFIVVKVVGRFLATGRMRGSHLLDIVARLPLEPRRSLYVVAVAGKTLLVGTSEMGLSVLSELDGAEVKARAVPTQSFGELVRSAWIRRRDARADVSAETRGTAGGTPEQTSVGAAKTADASSVHGEMPAGASSVDWAKPAGASSVDGSKAADASSTHEAKGSDATSSTHGAKGSNASSTESRATDREDA